MYKLNQIKLNINHSEADFKSKIAKTTKVSVDDIDWSTLLILHKSIDARDKSNILFVYNIAFDFVGASTASPKTIGVSTASPKNIGASTASPKTVGASTASPKELATNGIRPIVVGFGPAGIFASYIFALNGLKPIVIERGKALEDRIKDVDKFFETMELDDESNVCFGEGGAGAFSDGKLNTNNKDRTGIYHFVLETFVKFGADEKILYENMPHIGTDKLVVVIKNIRNEIIKLGGEIHYNTKLKFENGLAVLAPTMSLALTSDERMWCRGGHFIRPWDDKMSSPTIKTDAPVILAIGNSSRDTFRELIENGFDLKAKAFAIGYRVAHRQEMINESQYGGSCNSPAREESSSSKKQEKLGAATYKLTYDVGNGHSVYSFCMCPGGYIINSSNYRGMLSINGMSYNDRGGKYANSAIVETISPEDILGSRNSPVQGTTGCRPLQTTGSQCSPLQGGLNIQEGSQCSALQMIEFQEMIEKKAFELEQGFIPYATSNGSDICQEEVFKGKAKYSEKLKTVFEGLGLTFNINEDIEKAMKHFDEIIPGFYSGSQCSPLRTKGPLQGTTGCRPLQAASPHFVIAGVETRTSSPVKLDRDENYMCNVPNYYPCGEGLGHGGGIISCAADGVRVAMKIIETRYAEKTV